MESISKKMPVPPYVAYKTLRNFVERYRQGLPARIDRGLMGSMSGAAQSQVTTALRYLGMISEHGIPTEIMRQYATGEDEARKAALREVLQTSYPYIFSDVFDFSATTGSQLREAFETHTTATGETIGRCIAFLKDAAVDAGIVVSPFISHKVRGSGPRRKFSTPRKEENRAPEKSKAKTEPRESPPTQPAQIEAQASLLLRGLFQRLPKPGSAWPKEDRERWVQTLNNVLLLEYPEVEF